MTTSHSHQQIEPRNHLLAHMTTVNSRYIKLLIAEHYLKLLHFSYNSPIMYISNTKKTHDMAFLGECKNSNDVPSQQNVFNEDQVNYKLLDPLLVSYALRYNRNSIHYLSKDHNSKDPASPAAKVYSPEKVE